LLTARDEERGRAAVAELVCAHAQIARAHTHHLPLKAQASRVSPRPSLPQEALGHTVVYQPLHITRQASIDALAR